MNRSFRLLWSASTLSALGDGIRHIAFPLIAASYSSDPRSVALVFAAGYLPWPLFGLLGGVASDRFDRRTLLWVTDVARAAVVAVFLVTVLAEGGGIAALMVVSFLIGTAETVFDSSASSIVPQIVGRQDLEKANSWIISAQTAASTLIGAVAGALLFELSRAAPLVADTACFVIAAVLVAAMAPVGRPRSGPTHTILDDLRHGMRWLWSHRVLRTVCGLVTVMNGVIAAAEAVLVLYAASVLHVGGLGYGLLLALLALSSVAGGMIAPAVRRRSGYSTVLIGGAALLGGAIVIAGVTSNLTAALIALTLAGLANGAWNVVAVSLRQMLVPEQLLGRVTSIYRTVGLTAMPVGAVLAGLVAERFGLHAPFLGSGLLLLLAAAAAVPILRSIRDPATEQLANLNGEGDANDTGSGGSIQP